MTFIIDDVTRKTSWRIQWMINKVHHHVESQKKHSSYDINECIHSSVHICLHCRGLHTLDGYVGIFSAYVIKKVLRVREKVVYSPKAQSYHKRGQKALLDRQTDRRIKSSPCLSFIYFPENELKHVSLTEGANGLDNGVCLQLPFLYNIYYTCICVNESVIMRACEQSPLNSP